MLEWGGAQKQTGRPFLAIVALHFIEELCTEPVPSVWSQW
jgi:hypothetical protein